LNSKYLREELKIPLPPLSVQQQIVAECEAIESAVSEARKLIEEAHAGIESHVRGWFRSNFEMQKVEKVFSLEYGKSLPEAKRVIGDYPVMGSNGITGYHNEYLVEAPAIIVGRKGSAGKITYIDKNCYPIDTTFYVNPLISCSIKYLYCILLELKLDTMIRGIGVPGINRNDVYQLTIPVPSLSEQEKLVAEIEILEQAIRAARQVIDNGGDQKRAVMEKYL
jgi:restriction endonuclease S subunit